MVVLDAGTLLLAAYLIALIGLNFVCGLISAFYQHRLGEPSPRAGYVATVVLLLIVTATLFGPLARFTWTGTVQGILLFLGGTASAWNSASLFLTMKRIRK